MSNLKACDLISVGTKVRVNVAPDRFAYMATGRVIAHNLLPPTLGVGEVHTLCYRVGFDEPQQGKDDEFGHNYTPPGGFTSGVFRFDEVVIDKGPGFDSISGEPMTEKETDANRMSNPA